MAEPRPGDTSPDAPEPVLDDAAADQLVARIDALLATRANSGSILRALTQLLTPSFGDWASLSYRATDNEPALVIVNPADESQRPVADAIENANVKMFSDSMRDEVDKGEPILIDDFSALVAPMLTGHPHVQQLYESVGFRSTIFTLLPTSGDRPGLLAVSMTDSGRHYTRLDVETMARITRSVRHAIENTILRDQMARERTLRDTSVNLLDAVFDESPLGLAFVDPQLHFQRVNETFASLVNLRGTNDWGVSLKEMNPQLAELITPSLERILHHEEPAVEVEFALDNPESPGGVSHFIANLYGVRGTNDDIGGAGIALLDVTARVRAERARSRSDSQLRIAVDVARMGLFRWDNDTDQVQWSAGNATLLGLDPLDPPSIEAMLSVIHEDDRGALKKLLDECVEQTGSCETTYRVANDDGSLRWIMLKAQTRTEMGTTETVGVQLDITEQRAKSDEQARLARLQAQAGEQAVRMQRVSAALTRALTVTQVCDVLVTEGSASLGAPRSTVYLLDEQRDAMEIVRTHGIDFDKRSAYVESVSLDADMPITQVVTTGEPIIMSSRDALAARFPHLVGMAEEQNTQAFAVVRLEANGRVFGGWALTWTNEKEFEDGELIVLLALAAQGGQAIERARMFERERLISTALQRTLLPAELPDLLGATVARRYVPGATDIEVGGDWYDVIALSPTRVALVIGDVSGHNVDSAAVMGQVRNAVRSYAWEGHQAGRVLEATNRLLCGLEPGVLITCCFVELNLEDGIASVALAGHPPPLIRRVDGTSELIEMDADPPVGTDVNSTYAQSSIFLGDGDSLVMYTDGLVETRDMSLGNGMTYLTRAASASDDIDPDGLANFLLNALDVPSREDDVALLVLRYEPLHAGAISTHRIVKRHLVSTPASAGVARRFASDVLSDWGVIELTDQVSLCISELVTNALIHTATDVELVLRLSSSSVRVEIVDQSERMPVIRERAEGDISGRGLQIVEALADSWGIDSTGNGKSVWFSISR